jgi:hypothetical protein
MEPPSLDELRRVIVGARRVSDPPTDAAATMLPTPTGPALGAQRVRVSRPPELSLRATEQDPTAAPRDREPIYQVLDALGALARPMSSPSPRGGGASAGARPRVSTVAQQGLHNVAALARQRTARKEIREHLRENILVRPAPPAAAAHPGARTKGPAAPAPPCRGTLA